MYFLMPHHKKMKKIVQKIKKKPIFRPTEYTYTISSKSVKPFRRSMITKTVIREFYSILDLVLKEHLIRKKRKI
jgi:hypothetical protein